MQFYWSNFQDTGLVDIVVRDVLAAGDGGLPQDLAAAAHRIGHPERRTGGGRTRHSIVAVIRGWSPFIYRSMLIFLPGCRP